MYYDKIKKEQLVIRDLLAADRTILANERTLLAYARTALTLFIAGVSFIHFYPSEILYLMGWGFIPAAILTMYWGMARFFKLRKSLIPMLAWEEENVEKLKKQ